MKTILGTIAVMLGMACVWGVEHKMDVAHRVISHTLSAHTSEIRFAASLSPLVCEWEAIEGLSFSSPSAIGKSVHYLERVALPQIRTVSQSIESYDTASEEVRASIVNGVRTIDRQLETAKSVVHQLSNAEGFLDLLGAGIRGYGLVEELPEHIETIKSQITQSTEAYMTGVGARMEAAEGIGAGVAQWAFEHLYSDQEQAALANFVTDEILRLAKANAGFKKAYASGCLNQAIADMDVGIGSLLDLDAQYHFQVVCLANATSQAITYQYAWDAKNNWTERSLAPGQRDLHSTPGTETLYVRFDQGRQDSSMKSYWLRSKRSGPEKNCQTARQHEFIHGSSGLDVRTMN